MTELAVNDLVGIRYKWGASPEDGQGYTDCWNLVCCVRRRLELTDYSNQFNWVYKEFAAESVTMREILRWLHNNAVETEQPELGDIVYLRHVHEDAALGVYIGNSKILFIGGSSRVVTAPVSLVERPRFFRA